MMALAPFTAVLDLEKANIWEPWYHEQRPLATDVHNVFYANLADNESNHALSALYDPFGFDDALAALIYNSAVFSREMSKLSHTWPSFYQATDPKPPDPYGGYRSNDVAGWVVRNYSMNPDSSEVLLSAVVRLYYDFSTSSSTYQAPEIDWLRSSLRWRSFRDIVSRFVIKNKSLNCKTDSLLACFAKDDAFLDGLLLSEKKNAIRLLKALFRLINLAESQTLVLPLLKAGYESAFQIYSTPLEVFRKVDPSQSDLLTRTYENAQLIASRNHVESKSTRVAISDFIRGTGLSVMDKDTAGERQNDLDRLFERYCFENVSKDLVGEIDNFKCMDCKSYASPAAYFVEILRFLSDNAREHLLQRRPDLANLQLSCENSEVALPYMDLANEVMESYIQNLRQANSRRPAIDAFNTLPEDDSADLMANPKIVAPGVYSNELSHSLFPFNVLPYSLDLDRTRLVLKAIRMSRYELLTTFQDGFGKSSQGQKPHSRGSHQTAEASSRAITAEALNLCQEDYIAITKTAFWPEDNSSSLPELYRLWGFESSAAMADVVKMDSGAVVTGAQRGLAVDEFLARSGLSYPEYVRLAATRYIGSCLQKFDGKESNDIHYSLYLPPTIWYRIQSFLRLRLRSGFSMEELDEALMLFEEFDPSKDSVDPETLDQLVIVKKLSERTKIDRLSLLILWGDIPLAGPQTLFKSLFLRRNIVKLDPVFLEMSKKDPNADKLSWHEHLHAILAAVGCTTTAYANIEATDMFQGVRNQGVLNMENLSLLYRCCVVARCMEIPQTSISTALDVFPHTFLAVPDYDFPELTVWDQIRACGFTIDQVRYIIAPEINLSSPLDISQQKILKAAKAISTGFLQVRDRFKRHASVQAEQLHQLLLRIFDPDTSNMIMDFLLGESIQTVDGIPPGLKERLRAANILPTYLRYVDEELPTQPRLELQGMMSKDQMESLQKSIREKIREDKLADAVSTLHDRAMAHAKDTSNLINRTLSPTKRILVRLKEEYPDDPLLAAINDGDKNLEVSSAKEARLSYLYTLATSYLKRAEQEEIIAQAITSVLANADSQLVTFIIRYLLAQPHSEGAEVYTDTKDGIFGQFVTESEASTASPAHNKPWSGYLSPSADGSYTFCTNTTSSTSFGVQIDGVMQKWLEESENGYRITAAVPLVGERVYNLTLPAERIQWKHTSMPVTDLGVSATITETLYQLTEDVIWRVNKILIALGGITMSKDELSFFQVYGRQNASFNFYDFDLTTLKSLCTYDQVRKDMTDILGKPVLELFRQIYTALQSPAAMDGLATSLGISQDVLDLVMPGVVHSLDRKATIKALQGIAAVHKLVERVAFLKKNGIDVNPSFLDRLGAWVNFYEAADGLVDDTEISEQVERFARSRVGDTAWDTSIAPINDLLRQRRRDALVAYLLQLKSLQDLGVTDADSLFEFFLIDMQMGRATLTSRIKQAISSVQLFVKRSLLGYEPFTPTKSATIGGSTSRGKSDAPFVVDRTQWSWFQNYRVWEANRKISLFPEHWLSSSMLDIKTQIFEALMTKLQQDRVTMDAATTAFEEYLHGLNDIANLQYLTYYQDDDVFHVFARSLKSPYTFYYRSYSPKSGWNPWQALLVDIPVYQLDVSNDKHAAAPSSVVGSYLVPFVYRSRLLLFIPKFSPVELPGPKQSFNTQSTQRKLPMRTWSIQLSCSEYKTGKWSHVQTLPGVLTDLKSASFLDSTFSQPPNVAKYAFSVDSEKAVPDSQVKISVYRQQSWKYEQDGQMKRDEDQAGMIGKFIVDCSNIATESVVQSEVKLVKSNALYQFQISAQDGSVSPALWEGHLPRGFTDSLLLKNGSNIAIDWTGSPTNAAGAVLERFQGTSTVTHNMYHPLAHDLLDSMLDPRNDFVAAVKFISMNGKTEDFGGVASGGLIQYDSLAGSYSAYNWEVGLFIPMLVAEYLLSAQQFDDALNAIRAVFDPHVKDSKQSCWLFKPFQDLQANTTSSALLNIVDLTHQQDAAFDPFLVARERPQRFMIWVVLKYIQILIAQGDYYFRRNTLESIPEALQCYIEASHVYGPRKEIYEDNVKLPPATFAKLIDDFSLAKTDIGKFLADMECYSPYYPRLPISKTKWLTGDTMTCKSFCMPQNVNELAVRDTIDDRLFKIRNSLDISGNPRILPLFEPPIDPGMLIRAASSGSLAFSNVVSDLNAPLVNLRFKKLMQKALDTCYDLRICWPNLLSAKTSRDEAMLARLLATQNTKVQKLSLDLKNIALDQAKLTRDALVEAREAAVDRMKHFLKLTGNDVSHIPGEKMKFEPLEYDIPSPVDDDKLMTSEERDAWRLKVAAGVFQGGAIIPATAGAFTALVPQFETHIHFEGIGESINFGGEQTTKACEALTKCCELAAELMSQSAGILSAKAELRQRLAERQLEVNEAGSAIKAIDKQYEIQDKLVTLADTDVTNQKTMMDLAAAVEDCLSNRQTNVEMLTWLDTNLQTIYYETYTIVYDLAKKAEKAYRFELGIDKSVPDIIDSGYFDLSRNGAYAGEKLYNAMKRLQTAYDETKGFDFEISKTISLRQLDPLQLFKLRSKGACEFSLPEFLFDLDFPGHTRRRIKSVSISLRGVEATSIASTLNLLQHQYRVKDSEDSDFQSDNIPINNVAISTPSGDNGTSLDFSADTFLPFEGAGVISKWSFELSPFSDIDPATISDLVIQLRYTSSRGSNSFKASRMKAVQTQLSDSKEGMFSAFDLSVDFDKADWDEFAQPPPAPRPLSRRSLSSTEPPPQPKTPDRLFHLSGILQKFPYSARVTKAGATAAASKLMTSKIIGCWLMVDKRAAAQGNGAFALENEHSDSSEFSAGLQDPDVVLPEWSLLSIGEFNQLSTLQDLDKSFLTMKGGYKERLRPIVLFVQWNST